MKNNSRVSAFAMSDKSNKWLRCATNSRH